MKTRNRWPALFMAGLVGLAIPGMAAAEAGKGPAPRPPSMPGAPVSGGHRHHHHWWPGWAPGWVWGWGPAVGVNVNYPSNSPSAEEIAAAILREQQQQAALQQAQAIGFQQGQLSMQKAQQTAEPAKSKPTPLAATPKSLPVTTPQVTLTPEERAAGKFKLAMRLAADGKTTDANDYCTEIVQKYPGTSAAAEAQQYLDKAKTR